jgi:hypothetical protein
MALLTGTSIIYNYIGVGGDGLSTSYLLLPKSNLLTSGDIHSEC